MREMPDDLAKLDYQSEPRRRPVWGLLFLTAPSLMAMIPIGIIWCLSSFHYQAGMVGNDYGEIEVWDSVRTSGVKVGALMLPYWIMMLACAAAAIASIAGLVRAK